MMGSNYSKKLTPPSDSVSGSSSSSNIEDSNIRIQFMGELGSYETECQRDPALQNFDSILQQRTIGAISILANPQMNSLSFDTLRQVTGCLLENNQQAVKFILACERNAWKNPELFDLVEDYFENTLQTLDLCTALEKCIKKARDSQLILQYALKCFEEEDEEAEAKYRKTFGELKKFKELGDPFTEEFFRLFQLVYQKQISMLEKLQLRKRKLHKKLKSVKAWRRISNVIFISAFATVLICSVVAAALAAPPVAAALAAAAAMPLGSVGKWIDTLWKRCSNVVKDEKDVIRTMEVGTIVAVSDLGGIRALVERLEIHIGSLLQNADFASRDEEAVKFGIEEIKKKLSVFMQSIEDLGKEVDTCSGDVQRARTIVLQKVIRDPN